MPSTGERFATYQASAASRMRYTMAHRNAELLHDLGRPRKVLDGAGGNGINAEYLLKAGHSVTLFDLILCHHVLEYTDQSLQILCQLHELATPTGDLSVITLSPVSEVIRAIVFRRDPELARGKLTDFSYDAQWFGLATLYPFEQIMAWAQQSGWLLRDYRAIRVLADYLPEQELTATKAQAMLNLEEDLAGQDPYRRLGRYIQFCFVKRM